MRTHLIIPAVVVFLLLTLSSSIAAQQSSATPEPQAKPTAMTMLPASVLDAELKTSRGHSRKLSDYSGKVLVIYLWATWCGPCRFETPELVKLQDQFRSQGVFVVGLSTEDPRESARAVRRWDRKYRVNYRTCWSPQKVSVTLMNGRDAIPQTLIVSRSGKIVKRFVGYNQMSTPDQLKQTVEETLHENGSLPKQNQWRTLAAN